MLKGFLNPRWRHPDPKVRRQAVEALSPGEDAEAIALVVREDALPAIRRVALRHVLDLGLLEERAERDEDDAVREHAQRRYLELMAGLDEAGPPLAERIQIAARSEDPALIEYLAREAKDDELRARAVARVERVAVLRDVTLHDPSPELRLEALARIHDEAVLARVHERSRKTDKRVSRAARERLDAMREARERPERVAAESEQICVALEDLGRGGHWELDADRLPSLERRWQALDVDHRQAFEARYATARQRAVDAVSAYRAAADASRTAREAAIARLESLSAKRGEQGGVEGWLEACETALREARAARDTGEPLPKTEEGALEARLLSAETAVREAMARERQRREAERLLKEHQRLHARKGAIAESDVKALGRAVESLAEVDERESSRRDRALAALLRRVQKAHGELRDRLRDQASWKKRTLDALPERLDALKTAVAEGRSSEAVTGYDTLTADLQSLLTAGTSPERLAKARKRLDALAKDIKIMRAWGRFGAKAAAERLCEQMELLKDSEKAPAAIAQQVREARAAWKELAKSAERMDQSLWRRFDAAATEAYLPCKAYFAERASARKANVERRRALVSELQRFLAATRGGPDTDWKGAVRMRRNLLKRWHDARPVERGPAKALAAAFDAHLEEMDELLGRERERSLRQREQLIASVEALAGSDDKKAAAEACKRLQSQWRVTVPGSRRAENALWERFRTACDAVFEERQQVFDEERAGFKAALEQRKVLCQRLEALADTDADGLEEAEHEFNRIQGEWSRGAPVPKREADAVEKRFTAAARRFSKRKRTLEAQRERDGLELLRTKAALCHEAELVNIHGADCTADSDAVAALKSRWQGLPTLPDADDEAALLQRFQQALTGDVAERPAENLAARQSICLRLEILAGVDSPPEHSEARLALQVERLAHALKDRGQSGGDTQEALLRAWCTAGPAPRGHAEALEARFERAWLALAGGDGADIE